MAKVAAIDIGTNTFLCLIAEVEGKSLKVIEDVSRVIRLGEKVQENKKFIPEALARAKECLEEFKTIIEKHKVDHVVATATSAARDASNGEELVLMGKALGIPINIIGGSREATLTFAGAVSGRPDAAEKSILVIDVGGGSTEFIFREAHKELIKAQSYDVGSVRLTEMFLKSDPIDQIEYEKLLDHVRRTIAPYGKVTPDLVIAVAGTPTTLACIMQEIDFDESKVEGYTLTANSIKKLTVALGSIPLEVRKTLRGLEPLRADVIVAGSVLLRCGLELSDKDRLSVSTRGLRYGVALHHEEFRSHATS